MQKELIQPARGMRDFSPEDIAEREALKELILSEYRKFGYRPIGTPVVENIEILKAKAGDENEKLMYQVLKRGDQLEKALEKKADLADLGLRFDLTVPLCRYVATHAAEIPAVFRVCRIDPVYRAERPQRGRYREFVQCDVDIIGADSSAYEVELLSIAERVLNKLNIGKPVIRISDRRLLATVLKEHDATDEQVLKVTASVDRVAKIGKEAVLKEIEPEVSSVIQIIVADLLDGKDVFISENAMEIKKGIQKIVDDLKEINGKTNVIFDPLLMRGMDYYTGPIYEVELEGLNVSVGGGGRYDNLVGTFLGKQIPATGFSFGFERLLLILEEKKIKLAKKPEGIRIMSETASENDMQKTAMILRDAGLAVDVDFQKRKFEKKLKSAESEGITYVVTNIHNHMLDVRNLKERKTDKIQINDFIKRLKK